MKEPEFKKDEDYFFLCNPIYKPGYGTYSVTAVKKKIVHLGKLDDLAHYLNIDKQEGAHLFLVPTKFYMQDYLEFDKEYYICLYVQYWG